MDSRLNRAVRRKLKRSAGDLARRYVEAGIVLAGPHGGMCRLDNPQACQIVRQELALMLRRGGRPLFRLLQIEEACLFPFTGKGAPGLDPWLAVGLDLEGRATIVTRWLPVLARSDCKWGQACRLELLSALAAEQQRPGFAMPPAMGRA